MEQDARQTPPDPESRIARLVWEYTLCDPTKEEEALAWLCFGLEWLLGRELEPCEEWTGWVDGVTPAHGMVPDAVKVVSGTEVSIHGYAEWARAGAGPFWIEPFLGQIRVSPGGKSIESYDLRFGDADRGLGGTPYGRHIRWESWFSPAKWMFRFTKNAP
jgi:hypothetical protein